MVVLDIKTIFNTLVIQIFIYKYQFNNLPDAKNNQRIY